MEAVGGDARCRKRGTRNGLHRRREVERHLKYHAAFNGFNATQYRRYCFCFGTFNHGNQCPFLSMRCFVGDDGVQLTSRELYLVDGESCAEILRKQHPRLGVVLLIPLMEATQMIAVLSFKVLDVNLI